MVIAVPCNGLNRAFKVPGTNHVQCIVMLESCKYFQRWIIPRSNSYRYRVDEYEYIDGLVRERRYYSALTMELLLPRTNPSIYSACFLCWITQAAFVHRKSKRLMLDLHCICTTIWHALQMQVHVPFSDKYTTDSVILQFLTHSVDIDPQAPLGGNVRLNGTHYDDCTTTYTAGESRLLGEIPNDI